MLYWRNENGKGSMISAVNGERLFTEESGIWMKNRMLLHTFFVVFIFTLRRWPEILQLSSPNLPDNDAHDQPRPNEIEQQEPRQQEYEHVGRGHEHVSRGIEEHTAHDPEGVQDAASHDPDDEEQREDGVGCGFVPRVPAHLGDQEGDVGDLVDHQHQASYSYEVARPWESHEEDCDGVVEDHEQPVVLFPSRL